MQIIDIDTAKQSTPKFNNAKYTKTKLTLNKKMLFKYSVALLPHSSFRILLHQITPDSTSDGSNSTVLQGTSNRTLKICLVTLSIANNDNNATTVGKAVNAPMKGIHGIEGDYNKVKIDPWKSKQPNLEVMK